MMTRKKSSSLLTAEQILGSDDLPIERVPVPEWGGHVFVRSMMAEERDAFEQLQLSSGVINARGRLCVQVIVDGAGKRMFEDAQAAALGKKGAGPMDRVFSVACRLNGFGAKDIEELEKN